MIDVLEQIVYYRKQKDWSEYQLAEESGLTQSTISSWYRKNMIPPSPPWKRYATPLASPFPSFSLPGMKIIP